MAFDTQSLIYTYIPDWSTNSWSKSPIPINYVVILYWIILPLKKQQM